MTRQHRLLVLGTLLAVVFFTGVGRVDAWHWRHRVYVPYMPVVPVGGFGVRGGTVTSGEAFFMGGFRPGFFGGAELFPFGATEAFYSTPRAPIDRESIRSAVTEAVQEATRKSPGSQGGGAPAGTDSCAGLGARIDKLTERIGLLEGKVDRIEAYIQAMQAEKDKKAFAASILQAVNEQRRADLQLIAEAIGEASLPAEKRTPNRLESIIKELRK